MNDAAPDLGDLIVALLTGTLSGVRDRLLADGFIPAGELVADLVEIADDYLSRCGETFGPGLGYGVV